MPNIPTTQETLQALDVLRRFVEGIEQTFIGIRSIESTSSATSVVRQGLVSPDMSVDGEPSSWAARVLVILDDTAKYMSPKEIISEYKSRGWKEVPDVDKRIRSTLNQLKKIGKVRHNTAKRTYKSNKEAN